MGELQVFKNVEFGSVRSITVNGEPFFVAKDVTDILGYQNGSRDVNRHVDEEDRQKIMVFDGNPDKETIIINESGLYSLILSSKLPSAKRFKRWVTSEVLPAIRKHGVFALDDIVNNTDALIEALQAFKAERLQRMALEEENAMQKQQLVEMKPKSSSRVAGYGFFIRSMRRWGLQVQRHILPNSKMVFSLKFRKCRISSLE